MARSWSARWLNPLRRLGIEKAAIDAENAEIAERNIAVIREDLRILTSMRATPSL